MTVAKTFTLDSKAFFAGVRTSLFGGSMSQAQVDGCEALLRACNRWGVTDQHHVAQVLA